MIEQTPSSGRDKTREVRVVDLPPRAAPAPAEPDTLLDLRGILGALWRNKLLLMAFVLFSALAGGYYAFMVATPMYRAGSVVVLDVQPNRIVDFESVIGARTGDSAEVNTELEVLRARSLMGRVVDELDLVSDPEFNGRLAEPGLIDRIKDWIKANIVGLDLTPPAADPGRVRDAVVSDLLTHVDVYNRPQTYVFQITVTTTDAEKSAAIANAVAELYIDGQLAEKFDAMDQATGWLSERVAELRVQLEEAEARRAEFSASTELISAEKLQGLEIQLKEQRDLIQASEDTLRDAEVTLAALQGAVGREEQAEVSGDPTLLRLLPRTAYSNTDTRTFDERWEQVLRGAELDLTRAERQLGALQRSEVELTRQIQAQSEDLIQLQQYTREAEAIRLLYENFLTRLNETAAQQGIQQADSRLLSAAVIPDGPAAPRKTLLVALSGMLGVLVGALVIFWLEARKTGYRTGRDLESHTGLSVLGQIPRIPMRQRRKVLRYLMEKPTSASAEAVRSLRTSLTLTSLDGPPKVILSTSSVPGEGKTTNALALGQSLATMGRRVLVIEGDLRRRTFPQYFDRIPKAGFVSVLAGEAELGDVVFRPEGYPAEILPAQKTKINAADLYSSERFRDLLAALREAYDHVIIDTPPVLVVPDARIVAQHSDAVLFTVRWDHTPRGQVEEALRLFRAGGQEVTGLVLAQIDPRGMRRYGYGGKYGAYGAYGSYGAKYYRG